MKTQCFALLAAAVGFVTAARAESPEVRSLSLQDCIQQALEHNLDLRIERYSPQLADFGVRGAYGAYDPGFSFSGQYDNTKAGKTLFEGLYPVPGKQTEVNSFNSTLSGLLPWGTMYSLGLQNIYDTDGINYAAQTNSLGFLAFPYSQSGGRVGLSVTQPLLKDLWLNPTRLNIQILKNRMKWTDLGLRQRIIDLVTQVELAYYDLKYGHESVKVQQSALELAQRLLAENKKRVEVGALAPLDEKQSEAEAAARQSDLISAQRNAALLENVLKQLLTDDFASWNKVSLEPSASLEAERQLFSLQDSWSKGLTLRPDFLQAQLDLEKQGIEVKINRNELYPQVDLKAGGGWAGSTPEFSGVLGDIANRDQPFYFVGGQLTYPLGNRSARYNYKSSKAQQEVAQLSLKKLEQSIMVQIDNAIKLAEANYERVGATRKAREYAEAALAAEQKKLENGKSTSFIVLQLQRDLTSARSDEIQALVQHKRSLAQVAQAEGATLERNNINLDVK